MKNYNINKNTQRKYEPKITSFYNKRKQKCIMGRQIDNKDCSFAVDIFQNTVLIDKLHQDITEFTCDKFFDPPPFFLQ